VLCKEITLNKTAFMRCQGMLALVLVLLLAAGCAAPTAMPIPTVDLSSPSPAPAASLGSTLSGTGDVSRTLLTYDDLMNGFVASSPVDNAALALPAQAAPPEHSFEGRLELLGEDAAGEMLVLFGDPEQEREVPHLPESDFVFVQSGDYLVPVQRGLIIAEHPYWNLILEPGRVWSETGDHGYSRASFPFALVWKGSNATFNGVMTFLFDDENISNIWYQVTQETTISLKANMWGLLQADYHPGPVLEAAQVRAAFDQELLARFPSKPIEQLAENYPGVDATAFGRGVTSATMTWYGFVVNGVNYVGGCQTRYGPYPYCEAMRAPSYSTAKSAFVSVALMRLAQKYGSNVPDLLIRDYVPEAAESPGDWSDVTFNDTLDMASGNYRTAVYMVDEESWDTDPFWSSEYYPDLIVAAFNWPHSAPPGTRWVYRTSDTFIVTRALHNYLQTIEGPGADIFEFVVDEVYKPLQISPGTYTVLRTRDEDWQGQPYGGLGQWWIPDDLAKITTLLNVDDGMIDGRQILHPDVLAAALQRNPDDRGVDIGPGSKYNNAFWANVYRSGYMCEVWVPQMLGYSGIVVALFPNGTAYYYASDNREFTWDAALSEANKIIPMCQ